MVRPTVLTERVVNDLATAIGLGATYALACKYAGISYDAFNEWSRGKFPRGVSADLKSQFSQIIEKSEGQAAVKWLAKIERASDEHWQAAAWKLERRYPRDYGRSVTEHAGEVTTRIELVGVDTEAV